MLSCHQCHETLTTADTAQGVCPHCGADLSSSLSEPPRKAGTISGEASAAPLSDNAPGSASSAEDSEPWFADTAADTGVEEDEAVIVSELEAGASEGRGESTVHSKKEVGITNDADLDVHLRTILVTGPEEDDDDYERTMGMDSLESDVPAGDVTAASDSQVSQATDVHDSAPPKGSTGSQRGRSRAQASESKLNIPERKIVWADMSMPPDLSADYEIIPVENKSDPKLMGALGRGGVGIVWKALQKSLNREVAIKQLTEMKSSGSNSRGPTGTRKVTERDRRSFLAEAVITANLEHPNIMPVYDLASDTQGSRLYTMKLLRNPSWDKVIDDRSEEENLAILQKVCEAIDYAHEQGIVHRDLKPQNIVVGEHGEVLVIDWGLAFPLAHFQGPPVSPQQTGKGGTPTYMAPEQSDTDPAGIGTHTDIYLLGAILFEIVTGMPPHPYRSTSGKSYGRDELFKIVEDNVIIDVDESGELMDIARKAMRTSPHDRYPSVKKFLEALKNYQKHTESTQLVRQANQDLQTAGESQDYAMFARSVFGFENAQKLWEANNEAREGLLNARLAYAQAALKKKDFDFGLTLVEKDRPAEAGVYKKLVAGREARRKDLGRSKLYRTTALVALVLLAVGGPAAALWVNTARQAAIASAAKEKAAAAKEKEAKDAALQAQAKAEEAAKLEEMAKNDALLAKAAEEEATKREKLAKNDAILAKNEAVKDKEAAIKAKMEADKAKEAEEIAREEAVEAAIKAEAAKDEALIAEKKAKDARIEEEEAKKRAIIARMQADESARVAIERKLDADEARYDAQLDLAERSRVELAFDNARSILASIGDQVAEDQRTQKDLPEPDQINQQRLHERVLERVAKEKELCRGGEELVAKDEKLGSPELLAVAASPNVLATANVRRELQLWSPKTRKSLLEKPIQLSEMPTALALSPDTRMVAVGDGKGIITLWDTQTGASRGVLQDNNNEQADEIIRLMFLPDRSQLVSTSGPNLRIWNLDGEQTSKVHRGPAGTIRALARVADHKDATVGLITGGDDKQLRYWNLTVQPMPPSVKLERPGSDDTKIHALAVPPLGLSDDLLRIFSGDENGDLKEMQLPHAQLQKASVDDSWKRLPATDQFKSSKITNLSRQSVNRHFGGITGLQIDPAQTNRLFSVGRDNLARIWDIKNTEVVHVFQGHGNAIVDAAVWKDAASGESRLLTASLDGTARIWVPESKEGVGPMGDKVLSRLGTASGDVLAVSVDKNGDRVLAVSRDGIGMVWDLAIQAKSEPLDEGHHFMTKAAVKLKHLLVTVSFDGTAIVWDTEQKTMLEKRDDAGPSGVAAGTPDGKLAITGFASPNERDKNLQVWPLKDTREGESNLGTPTRLDVGKSMKSKGKDVRDQPEAVAVSPSGQWAAVATRNGYLQVFPLSNPRVDPPTGTAHAGGAMGVVFLNETEVASVGLDGVLRFWKLDEGKLTDDPQRDDFKFQDPGEENVYRAVGLAASEDGRTLAAAVRYPTIGKNQVKSNPTAKHQLWLLNVGESGASVIQAVQPAGTEGEMVQSVAISGDGQKVIAGIRIDQRSVLREWTIAPDGLSAPVDLLNPQAKDGSKSSSEKSQITQAIFATPDSHDEIIVSGDALTNVWRRVGNGLKRDMAYGPMMAMHACDLSPDGQVAVTASHDLAPADDQPNQLARLRGEIRVWEVQVKEGQLKAGRAAGHSIPGAINSVAICPTDSNLIAVGGYQRSEKNQKQYVAQLYRRNGTRLDRVRDIGSHRRPIISVQFTAEGTKLLAIGSDGLVSVATRGDAEVAFEDESSFDLSEKLPENRRLGELVTADLSADGRWLAVADRRASVLVNAETGEAVVTELLQGHASDLTNIKFSAQTDAGSPRLWSTSLDGSIKYWSLSEPNDKGEYTPRPMLTLRGHQRGVLTLAALPDGGIASGGNDGRVILWPSGAKTK